MEGGIGVFDSGVGGLTVVSALRRHLPHESIVYLGDTARVPYGIRSPATVRRYARECTNFLKGHRIKALVAACNTVSAVALDDLRSATHLPVLGVIDAGARAALAGAPEGPIGVLATRGTVQSGAYTRAIHAHSAHRQVVHNAAPLLVPLVEEGWTRGAVTESVLSTYLAPLFEHEITALILGCTHYPLLRPAIESLLSSTRQSAFIPDVGLALAQQLEQVLLERNALNGGSAQGSLHIHVTDPSLHMQSMVERFLHDDPSSRVPVHLVQLEECP